MNYWMMMGDWAPMPMNVREPAPPPRANRRLELEFALAEEGRQFGWREKMMTGKHYDMIDQLNMVVPVEETSLEKLLREEHPDHYAIPEEVLKGFAKCRTATEAAMTERAFDEKLVGISNCPKGCIGSKLEKRVGDTDFLDCGHSWTDLDIVEKEMKEGTVDFYESTPTLPRRLQYHDPEWQEETFDRWVYVTRRNHRGETFTLYRYPPTESAAGTSTSEPPSDHPSAPSDDQPGPGAGAAPGRSSA